MAHPIRSRRDLLRLLILVSPSLLWLVVFFLLPLLLVFAISFGQRGTYGGVQWTLTLSNYIRLLDPLYLRIFLRTLLIAGAATALCALIGYPMAFFIATRPARWRNTLLFLLVIPFWTNFLVRMYAWLFLLRDSGPIHTLWTGIHTAVASLAALVPAPFWEPLLRATSSPLHLFGTDGAVIVGLVYAWLPDMVLPCYAAVERLDPRLVEAAQDLYATRVRAFLRVVFPLTRSGLITGSVLVFVPCVGAYVTPDLLGGARTVMIGNVIYSQ
ncbi:MAG: ABC transporter permease, partial [Thermoflexia bacterium]